MIVVFNILLVLFFVQATVAFIFISKSFQRVSMGVSDGRGLSPEEERAMEAMMKYNRERMQAVKAKSSPLPAISSHKAPPSPPTSSRPRKDPDVFAPPPPKVRGKAGQASLPTTPAPRPIYEPNTNWRTALTNPYRSTASPSSSSSSSSSIRSMDDIKAKKFNSATSSPTPSSSMRGPSYHNDLDSRQMAVEKPPSPEEIRRFFEETEDIEEDDPRYAIMTYDELFAGLKASLNPYSPHFDTRGKYYDGGLGDREAKQLTKKQRRQAEQRRRQQTDGPGDDTADGQFRNIIDGYDDEEEIEDEEEEEEQDLLDALDGRRQPGDKLPSSLWRLLTTPDKQAVDSFRDIYGPSESELVVFYVDPRPLNEAFRAVHDQLSRLPCARLGGRMTIVLVTRTAPEEVQRFLHKQRGLGNSGRCLVLLDDSQAGFAKGLRCHLSSHSQLGGGRGRGRGGGKGKGGMNSVLGFLHVPSNRLINLWYEDNRRWSVLETRSLLIKDIGRYREDPRRYQIELDEAKEEEEDDDEDDYGM